ncbi:MAG: hypothetical protein JRH11_03280 [Deltaproteobacteria bacterium]|nr:hypothetical protein [Deltaproteobacteria bacterium]
MTGSDYSNLIAAYLSRNYGERGLVVYREVSLGKSIIGKNRHVDVFCLHQDTAKAMAIECKYQRTAGTVDEKIPYTLDDLRAMHIPAFAAYAGEGFSVGVRHMLQASEMAASCLPDASLEPSSATRELDHLVAMTFGWWDSVLVKKSPFDLDGWTAPT